MAESMTNVGKLLRRNGRYYFRRRIPLDLRDAYGGKSEVVKSLRTSDFGKANELNRLEWVRMDREFSELRAVIGCVANGSRSSEGRDESFKGRSSHINATVENPTMTIPFETGVSNLVLMLRDGREAASRSGWLEEWISTKRNDLRYHEQVLLGKDSPLFSILQHDMVKAALRHVLDGEGAFVSSSKNHMSISPAGQAIPPLGVHDNSSGLPMSDLIDRWVAMQMPREKTQLRVRAVVDQLEQVVGPMRTDKLTSEVVQTFKEWLLASGVSPATGNNKLGFIRLLCRFARAERLISVDPCEGINIRVPKRRREEKPRKPFSDQQLAAVFNSKIYTEGFRPKGGGGEAAYWMPLLALFTGCRQRELGQLRTKDVLQERYMTPNGEESCAWVIRLEFDREDGVELKNEGSVRRIPLHDTLILTGFIEYVQSLRERNEARVFPELVADRFGNPTAAWSKWFGRWLRTECGVKDEAIVFHSFRHTFKHVARFCQLPPDVNNAITGHETGDVANSYGAAEFPLFPLVEGIKRYRIPNFIPPAPPIYIKRDG